MLLREPEDREELIDILRGAFERHLLDADALSMIEGVLSVSETTVRDIMIPRSQMDCVSVDDAGARFHAARRRDAPLALSRHRREQGRRDRHPARQGAPELLREPRSVQRCATRCGRRCSCRNRSASTCCCANSAPTATTSPSSSTNTAACRASSPSRTCWSRSSATSRTSTTSTRATTTSFPRRTASSA